MLLSHLVIILYNPKFIVTHGAAWRAGPYVLIYSVIVIVIVVVIVVVVVTPIR